MLRTAQLSYSGFAENQLPEQKTHQDFVQGGVDVAEQTIFQAKVRLSSGEQILHNGAELRTPLHEIDHAAGDCAEEHCSAEQPFGKAGSVGQVESEIASDELLISLGLLLGFLFV